MYKLAIVEDEDFIRDGLVDVICWNDIGYEVMETFSDAIEIIDRTAEFDVILSDIKMPKMSGIDLAKYLYENNSKTKIVLISAFEEFEYARKAIIYGVSAYLTKPIDTEELKATFQKLADEFEMNTNNICRTRNEFYHHLILGSLTEQEIKIYEKNLEPSLDFSKDRCRIMELKIKDFKDYINKYWEYDKSSLINSINIFFDKDGLFLCRILININDRIFVLLSKDFILVERHIRDTIYQLSELMNLEIEVVKTYEFKNIYEIAQNNMLFDDTQALINERGKLLYTIMNTNDVSVAIKIAQSIVTQNVNYSNVMEDINHIIQKTGKDITKLQEYTSGEIDKWVVEACRLIKSDNLSQSNAVDKIKEYININYMQNISLEELSQAVYLNQIYLSKFFKDKTGETFSNYLLKVRMEKAKEFLGNVQYKIYDVGEMVGYKSMKHFYKLFKNYTGYTPTEYRKRM